MSLAAGGGSGALVLFLGMQSFKEYKKCKAAKSRPKNTSLQHERIQCFPC